MSHLSIHFVPGTPLDVCKDLGVLLRSAGNLFIRGRAWNNLRRLWGFLWLWDQDIFITLCLWLPALSPGASTFPPQTSVYMPISFEMPDVGAPGLPVWLEGDPH